MCYHFPILLLVRENQIYKFENITYTNEGSVGDPTSTRD